MSMREKYGNFSVKDIVFYDEEERRLFEEEFLNKYQRYISKVNGKKIHGKGKLKLLTREEKDDLSVLNIQLQIDEENNTASMVGYGHRNTIFPIEMYMRKLFDEGRIVTYKAFDNLNRAVSSSDGGIAEENRKFLEETKRRIVLYKNGQLEVPSYRTTETKQNERTI